jgi:hypothetical protein
MPAFIGFKWSLFCLSWPQPTVLPISASHNQHFYMEPKGFKSKYCMAQEGNGMDTYDLASGPLLLLFSPFQGSHKSTQIQKRGQRYHL